VRLLVGPYVEGTIKRTAPKPDRLNHGTDRASRTQLVCNIYYANVSRPSLSLFERRRTGDRCRGDSGHLPPAPLQLTLALNPDIAFQTRHFLRRAVKLGYCDKHLATFSDLFNDADGRCVFFGVYCITNHLFFTHVFLT